MLQELNNNINMEDSIRHKLQIHHANLFTPKPNPIQLMSWGCNPSLLAVLKKSNQAEELKQPLSLVEIYKINPNLTPQVIETIIVYEHITGIVWITPTLILTVSLEQTINIYSIHGGMRVGGTITDYGSILCMKYSPMDKLLLTGTEYGYLAAYRINTQEAIIEPIAKMIKINGKIDSIDLHRTTREVVAKSIKKSTVAPARKRKRAESSDESEDEQENDVEFGDLSKFNFTIFGASKNDIVIWDYHNKTIIETIHVGDESCNVNTLLALTNGDIVAGDSTGTLNIFDGKTFTGKQCTKFLSSSILCLTKDQRESTLLMSGNEPTIMILKKDKSSSNEYVMFEKIEVNNHCINSLTYTTRKTFYTGAIDGILTRFNIKKKKSLGLQKFSAIPDYTANIKFSSEEMLIQYDRSLIIWRLPKCSTILVQDDQSQLSEKSRPTKTLLLRTRAFIHSSTFSDKWIVYATSKEVHIYKRAGENLSPCIINQKIPECNNLELSSDGQYLAASTSKTLYLIDLKVKDIEDVGNESELTRSVSAEHKLKGCIRQMLTVKNVNFLVVVCGMPKNYLYVIDLNSESKNHLEKVSKCRLKGHEISFISPNAAMKKDNCLYLYTSDNRLLKLDLTEDIKDVGKRLDEQPTVEGLPDEATILGLVAVSKDYVALYDNYRMYKVDVRRNKVVSQLSEYRYIVKLDNTVFGKCDHIALLELTPDDYKVNLPVAKPRKKFGQL